MVTHQFNLFIFRYWFTPVGISLGIKNSRPKKAPFNPILEKAYCSCKRMKYKQVNIVTPLPTIGDLQNKIINNAEEEVHLHHNVWDV